MPQFVEADAGQAVLLEQAGKMMGDIVRRKRTAIRLVQKFPDAGLSQDVGYRELPKTFRNFATDVNKIVLIR